MSSSSPSSITTRSPLQRLSTFKTQTQTQTPNQTLTTLDSFSSDPILSSFLSPSFSPTQFSSTALSSGSAASRIELLQSSLRLLDDQLRTEVLSKHPQLLHQLSSLKSAESNLSSLRSSISSLQSSLKRARNELSDPHKVISLQTKQLNNLHSASTLLQQTLRCLRMVFKLKGLINSSKWDLTKAGQLHCEILGIYNDSELGLVGIDVVDVEMKWVVEIGMKIREEGMGVFEKGLEGLNQPEVGLGLQVFYNLGELRTTVDGLVGKYKMMGVRSLGSALDMKAISSGGSGVRRDGMLQIGSGGKAKEALWGRMSGCMDQLHGIVIAVWHLQRVLAKKRDPFTLVLLLDEVIQEGDPTLTDRVWDALVKSFASQMKSAFTASSFVKEIFTLGYPKLLTMIDDLLERISRDTDVKGIPPAISSEGKGQMIAAIEMFQTAFLTLCLSRLTDLVNSVFPMSNRGNVPPKEHMLRVVSRIKEEIEAVHLDARLTLLVLREISKVLHLLAERAEYQISTGPEARQITGPATPAQLKNFTLCQNLQEVHTRITSIVSPLPTVASDVLSAALGTIYGVAGDSVTSLFQSMLDHLESCILQIHDQNFSTLGMDAATDDNSSPYMEELQKSILHFRSEFLSRLLPSSGASSSTETICTRLVRSMASRVLTFFIRHAALVRPLSESGKLRMARDMAELELAVGQNLFPVEQLGTPYRALRAFRPIIFLETSQLESSPLLQDLPASVINHHLYSRGPDDLLSPLQRNRLTPIQYSLWMDSQGEDQIWKGVKATLDDYAAKVRGRGDKEFDPVYPLMLIIGSSLTENQS